MTPQEIAEYLIENIDHPALDTHINQLRSHFSLDVIKAFSRLAYKKQLSHGLHGLQIARLSLKVAQMMGAEEPIALARWNQGNAYIALNRYEEALACYAQAEKYYLMADRQLEVAGLQINQVLILRDLGQYKQALTLASQAQIICANLNGKRAEIYRANLDSNIGWIYEELGEFEAALAAYDNGRRIYEKYNEIDRVARIDMNRAHLLTGMDRFSEAESILHTARAILTSVNQAQSVAQVDLNLGRVIFRRGQYQLALHYFEKALTGFAAIPLPVEVAVVNQHRLAVYDKLNLYHELINRAGEAVAIFRQNKMQRELILCLFYQGIGYAQLEMHGLGEKYLAQARRLLYQQGAQRKLWLVDTERAQLAWQDGRIETAWRIGRRVEKQIDLTRQPALAARLHLLLARCLLTKSPDNMEMVQSRIEEALTIAQRCHLPEIQIHGQYLLAQVLAATGKHDSAWQMIQQALRVCEYVRINLLLDEFQLGFMVDKLPIYTEVVCMAHNQMQADVLSATDLCFYLNLAQKAPLLDKTIDNKDAAKTPKLQAKLTALREAWHWHYAKLTDYKLDNEPAAVEGEKLKLAQIEADIAELRRRHQIQRISIGIKEKGKQEKTASDFMALLQNSLKTGEGLLQIYEVSGQLQAFLLTATTCHLISDLVTGHSLQQQLKAWRFYNHYARTNSQNSKLELAIANQHLTRLYQSFWKALVPYLHEIKHLYLVLPPGWQELPIAALYDGQQYVVEQTQLTYLTATETLLPSDRHKLAEIDNVNSEAWVFGYSKAGQVPQTVMEAETIANKLSASGWQTHLHLETAVTRQSFAQAAQSAQLLHLATHAVFRPDNPLFSWLALADGRLTVMDLHEMPLRQRPLVILSGCETGRGQTHGGGLLGMGRGFLTAGAGGLLLTLWRIEDQASAHLMTGLYDALTKERYVKEITVSAALRQAQLAAIADKQSPFFWSGYIFLSG